MATFDPDAYLAAKSAAPISFDPDAYLASKQYGSAIPQPGAVNPSEIPQRAASPGLMDRALGVVEAPYAAAVNMAGGAIAPYAAVAGELMGGVNTPEGRAQGARWGGNVQQAMSYQPQTQTAQDILGYAGEKLGALNLESLPFAQGATAAGFMPSALSQAGNVLAKQVRPAVTQGAQAVQNAFAKGAEDKTMVGMGAASTEAAQQRQATAGGLRVPIQLTKGQATREMGAQQFEAETAKLKGGEPLVLQQLQTNDKILKNFDAYAEATGGEAFGLLRPVGKIVDDALVKQANKAKTEINSAYEAAKSAGETKELVSYKPVFDYVRDQGVTTREKLAPILSAVEDQIKKNDPTGSGKISINAMEEIYKFIGANTQEGTPNSVHARQMKQLINASTEGAGGDMYRKARELRMQYGKQFEDVSAVDKLLRTKPGTSDRAVAFEDVFDNIVLKGSRDDTRNVAVLLKKGGEQGQQAWKEIQGQTIQYIKDAITKSTSFDQNGNPIPSPAKFNTIVRELDADGKLDYIFGKKGAQEIRDLKDTAMNVYTKVPGAVNYSNTASSLINYLDKISKSPLGALPLVKPGLKFAQEQVAANQLAKQVGEAVNYNALTK